MDNENQGTSGPTQTELDRTYGGAAAARPPARDLVREFGERAATEGEAALKWIKARPVTTAAISLGIGVLIGLALDRSVR